MILTSNQSFGAWGDVFGDRVIATAILDRLLHHAVTLNIRGNSYRLKEKLKSGLVRSFDDESQPGGNLNYHTGKIRLPLKPGAHHQTLPGWSQPLRRRSAGPRRPLERTHRRKVRPGHFRGGQARPP